MKDYTLDKESKKKFIVDMYVVDDRTITVIFADGTQFEGIAYTEENIDKIRAIQEKQAKEGVANLPQFVRKARLSEMGVYATVVTGFVAAGVTSCTPIMQSNPTAAGLCIGAATVIASVPSLVKTIKNRRIANELKKVQYRDENRQVLDSYTEYPNALAGVKNKVHFTYSARHGVDPYSILSIDCFTREDLEKIVENQERQDACGFTYQKRRGK